MLPGEQGQVDWGSFGSVAVGHTRSRRRDTRATDLGPRVGGGPPRMTTVRARRYQCPRCGTCMLVVPGEALGRRLYTAPAIGLALALWALLGLTAARVRARVSPLTVVGAATAGPWTTLRRWARETIGGRLFPTWRSAPETFTLRKHAERAAAMLRALAPPDLPVADAVFAGAAVHRPARSRSARAAIPANRDPAAIRQRARPTAARPVA
jgi:hypothetical protein